MPGRWSNWYVLEPANARNEDFFGIYQVRLVWTDGHPIEIPRIGGTDARGIIYIGRSGLGTAKSGRTLAKRLGEFYRVAHSGAQTLAQAQRVLRRRLGAFDYQYRVMGLGDADIFDQEERHMRRYLRDHCELPPYNSSFPGKWKNGPLARL